MAVIVLVGCWLAAIVIVISLIQRYRSVHSMSHFVLVAVFMSWLLPFSLTFLLPIDISSTRYEQCLAVGGACSKSWLYVNARIRHFSWLAVYWSTFLLTWIIVPFLQGYVIAGEFGFWGKVGYSLKLNLFFYGVLITIVSTLVIYLKFFTTITTWEGIAAFVMALTNAFGLLAVMMFLGHGLVRIPRYLWHQSNAKLQLRKLEKRALAGKEELLDAEQDLSSLIREIHSLPHRGRHRPELQSYIDELVNKAPVPSDEDLLAPSRSSGIIEPVSLHRLENLNYRLPVALNRRERAAWEWRDLLERAWAWHDIIENQNYALDRLWKSTIESPTRSTWKRSVRWWWKCRVRPIALNLISLLCMALSFSVFWSEVTMAFTGTDLSLVGPLIRTKIVTEEFLAAAMLLYLAICTYSSFLKLRILSLFKLVPGQHTDDISLLFFAAYITRFTFPLGYNYLMLIDRALKTEFARVMGTMDLVPLLGRNLNYYVPTTLSLICFLVLFRLHRKFTGLLDSHDDRASQGDILDGAELINQARREEERYISRQRLYSSSIISNWHTTRTNSFPIDNIGNNSSRSMNNRTSKHSSPSQSISNTMYNPWAK